MKNITEKEIIEEVKRFANKHNDFGYTISDRNLERFAEDLIKKLTIPVVVKPKGTYTCNLEGGKDSCYYTHKDHITCVYMRKCKFASV